jgi:hypothetical protein
MVFKKLPSSPSVPLKQAGHKFHLLQHGVACCSSLAQQLVPAHDRRLCLSVVLCWQVGAFTPQKWAKQDPWLPESQLLPTQQHSRTPWAGPQHDWLHYLRKFRTFPDLVPSTCALLATLALLTSISPRGLQRWPLCPEGFQCQENR